MPETKELGLFVPPEKAIELGELEQLEREQKQKVTRRMWFRWLGWGSILLAARPVVAGFRVRLLRAQAAGRLRRQRHRRHGQRLQGGRRQGLRRGQVLYHARARGAVRAVLEVPAPRAAPCLGRTPSRRWAVRPTTATCPLPVPAASTARATARSTTATARSSRARRRGRWTCSPSRSTVPARSPSRPVPSVATSRSVATDAQAFPVPS